MPYIITTRTTLKRASKDDYGVSRHAVATLEEARASVGDTLRDRDLYTQADGDYTALGDQCASLEAGGTIGPLPDGTVIEVTQVKWSALKAQTTLNPRATPVDYVEREIIDAWNAAQGVHA